MSAAPLKLRFTALLTAITFFSTSLAYGYTASLEKPSPIQLKLSIPEEFGEIDEQSVRENSPLIVHIQSAHGNYEAEKNIQAILNHLNKNYGFDLILLEGGIGEINPQLFNFFPENPGINLKIADTLLKKSELTGSEAFLIEKMTRGEEKQIAAFGIENASLYRFNREAFQTVLRRKNESEIFLNKLKHKIDIEANAILNNDLKDFLNETENIENLDNLIFFRLLKKKSEKVLHLDLNESKNQLHWPMTTRLAKLDRLREDIDAAKAEMEKGEFTARIKNLGVLFSMPEKDTRLSFEKIIEKLPANFSFEPYKNFRLLVESKMLSEEIKSEKLMDEITELKRRITGKLIRTEAEQKIISTLNHYKILKKLLALELSRHEFDFLIKNENEIKPLASGINGIYSTAVAFYYGAAKREEAMFQNADNRITSARNKKAVLVTGGFHSEGIEKLTHSKNYSYLRITPRITQKHDNQNYILAMLEANLDPIQKSQIESILKLQTKPEVQRQGGNPEYIREQIELAIAKSLGDDSTASKTPSQIPATINQSPPQQASNYTPQTKTILALKTLVSIGAITGMAYLIYFTPLKPTAVAHLGVNVANIVIFGYFAVINDFLGQWLSGRGVIKKQVAWALPLGLVLGVVTWGGFTLTNWALPKDVPIPVLAADVLRVGGIWMMIRFRTMLYAKMVSLVRKNGKSSEEQEKQFESFWMTRSLSFVKNYSVLKLIPDEFQTVAEGIANQYFQLFYSWSVNKEGFIFNSPSHRSSRLFLAFFPITATFVWMINRNSPPDKPMPQPKKEMNASSLGTRTEKETKIFARIQELMLISEDPRIQAEAASTETYDLPFSREQIDNIPVNSLAQFAFRLLLRERGLIEKTNSPIDDYQQALLKEELENALHGRKQLAEAVGRMKEVHAALKSRRLQNLDPSKPIFAVIGAGIAGSEIANQIKKQNPGAQFVIFDANPLIGGKILYAIPAFRPRVKLPYLTGKMGIANFLNQEGIYLVPNFVIGRDISYADFAKLPFDGVVFSGGNPVAKTDSIEGVSGSDVYVSTDIYRPYNTKKLQIPDNQTFPDTEKLVAGKTVVVIGGGNVSLDVTRIALEEGAKQAILLYRRGMDVFLGKTDKAERQGAEAAGTKFEMNTKVTKVIRDPASKKITHLELDRAGSKSVIQADVLVFAISDVLADGLQRKPDSATIVDKIDNPNFEWIAAGDSAVAGGGKAGNSLTSARKEFKRVNAQGTKTVPDREALIDSLVRIQASSLGYSIKTNLDFPDFEQDRDYQKLLQYSLAQGRALPRSVALTARYFAGNFLYIPGSPDVLNSYLRVLGITKPQAKLSAGVSAFNKDENIEKFLAYLQKQSAEISIPMLVDERVLNTTNAEEAANLINGALKDNDLIIAAVSGRKIPAVVSKLHRFGNRFKVRSIHKDLVSAKRIAEMTRAYKIPPVAVFSGENGIEIQLTTGDKIRLDLKALIEKGVNPIKVLTLIRKISDEPALRQILFLRAGFQFNDLEGVWEVGNTFIAHLNSIYGAYQALQQSARAA